MTSSASASSFYRSTTNRKFKGVCGGLAERFGWDATIVRLGWVLGTMFLMSTVSGWFFFSYFIAALVMHDRPSFPVAPTAPHMNGTFPNPFPSNVSSNVGSNVHPNQGSAFIFAGPTPNDPPIVVTDADLMR